MRCIAIAEERCWRDAVLPEAAIADTRTSLMPIFDDPSAIATYWEDDSNTGAGDIIWGSTPAMQAWQYGKYIKIDVPNWNNSTGTDPWGGVDPPLRSYLRLGSIEAPPFAQPPTWSPPKAPATQGKWAPFKYTDGDKVPFPTPGKGPTPATPTWQNTGHYTNAWQGNLDSYDSQTAAQSSIVGLVWGAGGYNLPGNQVLNPDTADPWGTGTFTFGSALSPATPWNTSQPIADSPWGAATGTFPKGSDQLASGFAFNGPGDGTFDYAGGGGSNQAAYYGTTAAQDQISGGLPFNFYQFSATTFANASYTGNTTIKSSGPAFYQQLVANAPDSTGEDLASLVKGFADDSRIRTIPQNPQQFPSWVVGTGANAIGPQAMTWSPWGDLLGAQNTASRMGAVVGPAIGYPQMSSLYVQAAPNWFVPGTTKETLFGARQTVGPTDPMDVTAWTPLPGYYQDFAGPGYVSDADYRAVESYYLHTKGGWRDHSDGNRITTTRGDKVEVIRGNYKLIVLGRQDQAKSSTAGMDISGGQTDTSPGGLAATSTTDPSTLTAIFELKQGPDRQYRSWGTTKKGTGTVKLGSDGVTVSVPAQGVTYGETWGWKTYALTGVETQPILSGGSGPPVGIAGWAPWGQGIGGYAPVSNTTANSLLPPNVLTPGASTGQSGVPFGAPPSSLPAAGALAAAVTQGIVPNQAALWNGGWDGLTTTAQDGGASTAYQIRTGGINPTTVGLLWPAFQNLTETHVVEQASITAIDTQVTLTMGQIPTMSTVAGTILDPIAQQLGYTLTQKPPIGSPSLPTDIGADITDAGTAMGTGGAILSTVTDAPGAGPISGNKGDNSWGSDSTGNPIPLGRQQAASPFFNYAGIPLQVTTGSAPNAAMAYPPVSVFPTAAAFVGQENILSDYRPYGPGYLFWPNPQTQSTPPNTAWTGKPPFPGAYTVNVTSKQTSDFHDGNIVTPPAAQNAGVIALPQPSGTPGLNALVRKANQLPKVRNSSSETHAMLSRTWSFVDSSFSHTEVTGLVNDAPPGVGTTPALSATASNNANWPPQTPTTTFPSVDPVATGGFPGDPNSSVMGQPAVPYVWDTTNQRAQQMPLPGDTPSGLGIPAGFAGYPSGFFMATLDFPHFSGTAMQTALVLAQQSGGTDSGQAPKSSFQGKPAVQFTESIVVGNSVAHTEVQGWSHSLTHAIDSTSETIVDGIQRTVTHVANTTSETYIGGKSLEALGIFAGATLGAAAVGAGPAGAMLEPIIAGLAGPVQNTHTEIYGATNSESMIIGSTNAMSMLIGGSSAMSLTVGTVSTMSLLVGASSDIKLIAGATSSINMMAGPTSTIKLSTPADFSYTLATMQTDIKMVLTAHTKVGVKPMETRIKGGATEAELKAKADTATLDASIQTRLKTLETEVGDLTTAMVAMILMM